MYSDFSDVLTNVSRPKTAATITLRVIKSFEYRTEKSLVLHNVNLETTTIGQLKDSAREAVKTQPGWKPYRNVVLDTLKLYTQAHSAKTTNLIINLDHDEWLFNDDTKILADVGFENETEVSFFSRELYEQFKQNPQVRTNRSLTMLMPTFLADKLGLLKANVNYYGSV
ncbi:hypothetical protein ARMGADRAFT_923529 [Armillaria gallica]|uniref:Uncharacterized protein n=1 Tax=Armillaria gallica TaxID=47427 RepID=A0A2H3EA59_ARMGA|nr:hypothetical protein ARMGADRAFT_923529 [Armillaria gallica]